MFAKELVAYIIYNTFLMTNKLLANEAYLPKEPQTPKEPYPMDRAIADPRNELRNVAPGYILHIDQTDNDKKFVTCWTSSELDNADLTRDPSFLPTGKYEWLGERWVKATVKNEQGKQVASNKRVGVLRKQWLLMSGSYAVSYHFFEI